MRRVQNILPALSVFLVAVPLCLGIAVASGADPLAGIIAGIIGGIIVGSLSDSPLSVSGPAAGLIAIVVVAIGDLGFASFLVALILAGCIQIIFGLTKITKFARYVPHIVVQGMLVAIGITIIIKQALPFVGLAAGSSIIDSLWIYPILSMGLISMIAILIRDRFRPIQAIPGSLIGVIVAVMGVYILKTTGLYIFDSSALVALPTSIDRSSLIHMPDVSILSTLSIYKVAITLALVASIETILSIQAVDALDPAHRTTNLDREMLAQGAGNMISGLVGGLPITSVIVRSSVNVNNGGTEKSSSILHGIYILIALLIGVHYINMIPLTALAAILILTGYKLVNPSLFVQIYKKGWSDFITFVITILCVLAIDLLWGVIIGVVVWYGLEYLLHPREVLDI